MANDRKIKSSDFANLKAKVKAEMLRRSYSGSVAAYGGSAYDYASPPTTNGPILGEHLKKNLTPMQQVNGDGLPGYPGALTTTQQQAMETKVAAWAVRDIQDRSGTDCKSGCTGTCYSSCQTGCYSTCSGSCVGSCSTTCTGGCTGSCNNTCAGGCNDNCAIGCNNTCKNGCASNCYVGCDNKCEGGCFSQCGATCATHCDMGCSGMCYSSCIDFQQKL